LIGLKLPSFRSGRPEQLASYDAGVIHASYAHVVTVQRPRGKFPTRFAALEALLSAVTAAGVIIEREAIPMDSGLDAIIVFSSGGDLGHDCFLIMRINADTFTITRQRGRSRQRPRVA
jgi:hypothetical protein